MTVATTAALITLPGNGVNTSFAYNFEIPYQDDGVTPAVKVSTLISGVTSILSPGQYSISGVGLSLGGVVTYTGNGTPLPFGATITIARDKALTQPSAFPNQGFLPSQVEEALDIVVLEMQQLGQNIIEMIVTNLPYLNVVSFGADPTGVIDSTAVINEVLAMASAGGTTAVVIPYGIYRQDGPITMSQDETNLICYGKLQASASFPLGSYQLTMAGNYQYAVGIRTDGFVAGTYCLANAVANTGFGNYLANPVCDHMYQVAVGAIGSGSGDFYIKDVYLTQWYPVDAAWTNDAYWIANGVLFAQDDCNLQGGTIRFMGPSVRVTGGTNWIRDIHPYNGRYAGSPGIASVDPIIIKLEYTSAGTMIRNCYLDQGHVDIRGSTSSILGCYCLQSPGSAVFSDATFIRVFNDQGLVDPFNLDIDGTVWFLAPNNNPANANPTSFIGFFPGAAITCTSASGNGTSLVIQFPVRKYSPSSNVNVTLAGWTPSGFNGTYTASAASTSSLTVPNATSGPATVVGTIVFNWTGDYSGIASVLQTSGFQDVKVKSGELIIQPRSDNATPISIYYKAGGTGQLQFEYLIGNVVPLTMLYSYNAMTTGMNLQVLAQYMAVRPLVGSAPGTQAKLGINVNGATISEDGNIPSTMLLQTQDNNRVSIDPTGRVTVLDADLMLAGPAASSGTGVLSLGNAVSNTATAGAATLPANPVKFINIYIGNVNYKIPIYAA